MNFIVRLFENSEVQYKVQILKMYMHIMYAHISLFDFTEYDYKEYIAATAFPYEANLYHH